MIGEKLKLLRKQKGFSMEYAAEKINVSRQTVAKWENGESLPDILKCKELASLYGISLDGLVAEKEEAGDADDGKYIFGIVRVGERGQIVLPQKARNIFQIEAGDQLVVLGDITRGMAIVKADTINEWKDY